MKCTGSLSLLASLALALVACTLVASPPHVDAITIRSLKFATASSEMAMMSDTNSPLDDELAGVRPISEDCTPESAVAWLTHVSKIVDRFATGGLASLPPAGLAAIKTLATQIVGNERLISDKRVLTKVVDTIPSIWATGFWYGAIGEWKPLLTSIFGPLAKVTKSQTEATECYDALVNATSLVIRFTKDNVFMDGVDDGASEPTLKMPFLSFLPELVASLSKRTGFTLTETQLRAYMNTIPSKKDGMDMSVAFPVYVDTKKYKDSDAAALRAFLAKLPPSPNSPIQSY